MAIHTVLRGKGNVKVKGITMLSGWVHDVERLSRHLSHAPADAPADDGRRGGTAVAEETAGVLGTDRLDFAIFSGHGTADEEITFERGRDGVRWLQEVNRRVQMDLRSMMGWHV